MPIFWGNRGRRRYPTEVTTSGTRIITPDDGHRHHRHRHHRHHGTGTTVVTVPATNVSTSRVRGTRVATPTGRRRYYGDNPSTSHGLWNKIIGTLTGNSRRRRHGDREMRKAREQREALRVARRVQRVRGDGHMTKLRKFHQPHRHHHHDPVVIAQDSRHRRDRGTPWLHHHRRTLPPYHGLHHRIIGFFTRGDRAVKGRAMAAMADAERRKERRHRRNELRDLGRIYREGRGGSAPMHVL